MIPLVDRLFSEYLEAFPYGAKKGKQQIGLNLLTRNFSRKRKAGKDRLLLVPLLKNFPLPGRGQPGQTRRPTLTNQVYWTLWKQF